MAQHGDPLPGTGHNPAGERHRHLTRQFHRRLLFALLYGVAGTAMLVGTVLRADEDRFPLLLAISLIVLALCGLSVFQAVLLHRKSRGPGRDGGA